MNLEAEENAGKPCWMLQIFTWTSLTNITNMFLPLHQRFAKQFILLLLEDDHQSFNTCSSCLQLVRTASFRCPKRHEAASAEVDLRSPAVVCCTLENRHFPT